MNEILDSGRPRRTRQSGRLTFTPGGAPVWVAATPTTASKPAGNGGTQSSAVVVVTDSNRGQLGLSTRLVEGGDYERLLMSLQSPLPNDQDMAISVCTLLSNETKHVLKLPRAPRILDLLLAHAGVYNQCKLRELMEESYWEARNMSHASFWMDTVPEGPSRHVLCECFVEKLNYSVGIDDYADYLDQSVVREADLTEEERGLLQTKRRLLENDKVFHPADCCSRCPCRGGKSENPSDPFPTFDQTPQTVFLIRETAYSDDRAGQRIAQIANILRNLSFEEENASVMAKNSTLLRFILISSECTWGTIPQLVLDLLGNLAQHLQLREPSIDPISCRILSLIVNGLFSMDRFRILRSLESLRELCKNDGNEVILNQYIKHGVYQRMCELLTISDIMLLIYTLECLLAMTGIGESVCNELCHVQGSVSTLVSLITVEAQSYGPKGCILMRVVETVTGNVQQQQVTSHQQMQIASSVSSPSPSSVSVSALPRGPIHVQSSAGTGAVARPSPNLQSATYQNMAVSKPSQAPVVSAVSAGQNHPSLLSQLQQPVQNPLSTAFRPVSQIAPPARSPSMCTNEYSHQLKAAGPTPVPLNHNVGPVTLKSGTPVIIGDTSHSNSKPVGASNHVNVVQARTVVPTVVHSVNAVNGPVTPSRVESCQGESVAVQNVPVNKSISGDGGSSLQSKLGSQTVFPNVTLPLVTPQGNLSEEGWAMAWLKGAFEVAAGSSIEQGESYRMYCGARKNPQKALPLEQFIQCMKAAHGSSVGPVIKQFGGGSALSFFEGIRPKVHVKSQIICSAPVTAASLAADANTSALEPSLSSANLNSAVAPNQPLYARQMSPSIPSVTPTLSVSANILPETVPPTRENKTLSPILKATLSRPPVQKGAVGSRKVKLQVHLRDQVAGATKMSPASSAIRSLLASKVAQRQQKKLEEGTINCGSSTDLKVNGLDINVEEESFSSSSMNSSEETDNSNLVYQSKPVLTSTKTVVTSFDGVLRNGIGTDSSGEIEAPDEDGDLKSKARGMLNHLLEKKVPSRENVNGVLSNREIRISEKGLELVEKAEESTKNVHPSITMNNNVEASTVQFSCILDGGDSQSQSHMTFYAARSESQVTTLIKSSTAAQNNVMLPNHTDSYFQSGSNSESLVTLDSSNASLTRKSEVSASGFVDMVQQGLVGGGNSTLKGVGNSFSSTADSSEMSLSCKSESSSCDEADLLEKFSQFSDLIMVSPEQLGIKRTHSVAENDSSDSSLAEPPAKKPSISCNVNGKASNGNAQALNLPALSEKCGAGIGSNLDVSSVPVSCANTTQIGSSSPISATVQHAAGSVLSPGQAAAVAVNHGVGGPVGTNATHAAVATSNASQVMQLRLAVNSQNQLAFTRQLVLSGQQLILSAKPQNPLQGQVIISKPNVASNDQVAKAIIILQQPQQSQGLPLSQPAAGVNSNPQGTVSVIPSSQNSQGQQGATAPLTVTGTVQTANPQLRIQPVVSTVSSSSQSAGNMPYSAQPQTVTQSSQPSQPTSNINQSPVPASSAPSTDAKQRLSQTVFRTSEQLVTGNSAQPFALEHFYLCEWAGCGARFADHNKVFMHVSKVHTPESLTDAVRCQWGPNGCDPLLRKRLSLLTHLQDRHCTKQALELSLYRRRNKIEPPPPPPNHPIQPHLGYAPNAAFHAIRRHALQFTNPKEWMDDNEGPVTKSIRLTSSLILKNIVMYSATGRRILRGYESQLASVAMSNVESSRTIAQLLYDLKELKN